MRPELLIVGAGPAGVSAALWARGLSLSALLLERGTAPGGQLHMVHFAPRDVAGVAASDGPAMAHAYEAQLAAAGVAWRRGAGAAGLEGIAPGRPVPAVVLEDGTRLEAEAVLIATGARRRRLEVPGARGLEGRGVSYSATRDRAWLAGRRVAVVGGGDAAFENALILAGVGCEVTLLSRGAARARPDFRVRVAAEPRIRLAEGVEVRAVLGEEAVTGLTLADAAGEHALEVEGVVVKIGVVPNSEWCRGAVAQAPGGWVLVDERFATSAPRVWAAGDVVRPLLPSIAVSMAQGGQAVAVVRQALHGA
jgi:thioredoxin reductase